MFADRAVMLVGDLLQIPPVRNQRHGKTYSINFIKCGKTWTTILIFLSSCIYATNKIRKQKPFQLRHESLEPMWCCQSNKQFQSWRFHLEPNFTENQVWRTDCRGFEIVEDQIHIKLPTIWLGWLFTHFLFKKRML